MIGNQNICGPSLQFDKSEAGHRDVAVTSVGSSSVPLTVQSSKKTKQSNGTTHKNVT